MGTSNRSNSKRDLKAEEGALTNEPRSAVLSNDEAGLSLSYADWLMTASPKSPPDRALAPWFSAEVRSVDDPRLRWINFAESQEVTQLTREAHSSARSEARDLYDQAKGRSHKTNQRVGTNQVDHEDPEAESAEEAFAGHYLDHIETVQRRDQRDEEAQRQRKDKRRRKSSRRSKSERTQSERVEKRSPPKKPLTAEPSLSGGGAESSQAERPKKRAGSKRGRAKRRRGKSAPRSSSTD